MLRRASRLLPAAVAVALLAVGCAHLQHVKVFRVSIVNDTRAPVVVRDCPSYCSSSPLVFHMQPGAAVSVDRVARDHKLFSVTTPAGAHLGCVDLYFRVPQPGARVPVSGAAACPAGRPRTTTAILVFLLLFVLALPFTYWLRRRL
jgi:hypothetical protein